jgi:hypothetical protein
MQMRIDWVKGDRGNVGRKHGMVLGDNDLVGSGAWRVAVWRTGGVDLGGWLMWKREGLAGRSRQGVAVKMSSGMRTSLC